MNMFEEALKMHFRFPAPVGNITVEDLFGVPLTTRSPHGASLDEVAKELARELRAEGEESFVEVSSGKQELLTKKLDILRHVIAMRQAERKELQEAAARVAQKQELLGVLHSKKTEELGKLSIEDLEEKINAL